MGRRTQQLAVLVILALAGALLAPPPSSAAPTWLQETTLSDAGQSAGSAQVVMDGAGNTTAVWARSDGAVYRVQSASRPAGGVWTAPTTISEGGRDAYSPQVAVDASGSVTAVWFRYDGAKDRIQASTRPAGGDWTTPTTLSEAGQDAQFPQIAVDPDGNATAVWYRSDGAHTRVQASTRPAGGAWSTPTNVSEAGENAHSPKIAVDPAGNTTAVWTRFDAGFQRIQASTRPADGTWTTPTTLSDGGQDAQGVDVTVDPAGNAAAVWFRGSATTYRIQASTRPHGGDWTIATTLSEPGHPALNPQVAVSPMGDVTVVWHRYDGAYNRVQASTRPAGGVWPTIPVTLSETAQNSQEAQVVVDSAGRAIAIWQHYDGATYRNQASLRPAGGAWSTPTAVSPARANPGTLRAAIQPEGNAVAIWDAYDGAHYRVRALGFDAVGPVVSALSVPATGTSGTPVDMSVAASDVWSGVAQPVWSFGDGASATGTSVSHTWTTPGSYTASVTLSDAVGNTTVRTLSISITAPAAAPPLPLSPPEITGLRLKPKNIEIRGPKHKTSTKVILRLTEDAEVRITLKRKGATGKEAKQKVVLRKNLDAGRTELRLTSKQLMRKLGKRHYKPGRYVVKATALTSAGKDKRSVILGVRR